MKKNKLIKTIKQATAGLLAGAMVLTGAPLGSMTSWASTLQKNYQLFDNAPTAGLPGSAPFRGIPVVKVGNNTYGGSQGTAFIFGNAYTGTNASGFGGVGIPGSYNSFNIGAITVPGSENTSNHKGYDGAVRSAYSSNWWTTYYGFGRTDDDTTSPSSYPVISPAVSTWSGLRPMATASPNTNSMGVFEAGNDGDVVEVPVPAPYKAAVTGAGASDKIEVRMEVKPTPDEQKLLVTWTGYNPNSYPVNFWIGAEADTMIGGTDTSPSVVSAGRTHLHMMDYFTQGTGLAWAYRGGSDPLGAGTVTAGANATALADFDAKLDSGVGRVWAGEYDNTASIAHRNWVFAQNKEDNILVQQTDAAAGFAGNLNMAPNGQASVSFVVSMRVAVYYVDPTYGGSDSNGYIAQPFKDIRSAVKAMEIAGVKKGYIYVASPTEIDHTIDITANMDLQIETSPYTTTSFQGKTSRGYFDLGGSPEKSGTETITRKCYV